jgi:AcrR family transcriptional regulator
MTNENEKLKAATVTLGSAINLLTKSLGAELAGVGAEALQEMTADLREAQKTLAEASLSATAGGAANARTKRAERAERTREDLLQAAIRVISEKGYEAASVKDIVAEAGYTKGALYTHFSSKQELFLEIIRTTSADATFWDNFLSHASNAQELEKALDELRNQEGYGDTILSLEVYLFALRHPEALQPVREIAKGSIEGMARVGHYLRVGEPGEPETEDFDTAMALASLDLMEGIMSRILPKSYDLASVRDRVMSRLMPPSAPAS